MGCPSLLTIITLLVLDDKLNLEGLLKECVGVDLLLDGQLEFYSPGVRLSPYKVSVDQFDAFEAFNIFETQG